jgi:hypothetical protein
MSEPPSRPGDPDGVPPIDAGPVDVRVPPPTNGAATSTPTASPQPEADDSAWTDQVTDLVVDVVDRVRERTTEPVIKGSRVLVYGVVAVLVAIPLIVVGIILIGRLLELFPGEIWIAYSVLGAIGVLVGLYFWGRRRPSSA